MSARAAALLFALLAGLAGVPVVVAAEPPAEQSAQVPAEIPAQTPDANVFAPVGLSTTEGAAASAAPVAEAPAVTGTLPAMNFYSSIAGQELFDLVRRAPQFALLDRELLGSPISLSITHSLQPTAGGKAAGLLSAIWAGGTLGLLPAVTSNSLVIRYEVRVHGREYVTYSYQRIFTRAVNIWAKDDTYGLGKDGLEWLRSTAAEFTAAVATDVKLSELRRDYVRYFGPVK